MSKTKNLLHIVFATKDRQVTLPENHKRALYHYINGILQSKQCYVHRINGYVNHVHMLIDLHPSISLANLVRDIKVASNSWLRANPLFPNFIGWAEGYYANSISYKDLESCREYIIQQELHHGCFNFDVEIKRLLAAQGEKYYEAEFR